jgi:hypothetical protein
MFNTTIQEEFINDKASDNRFGHTSLHQVINTRILKAYLQITLSYQA